jgi:hypothetical protein
MRKTALCLAGLLLGNLFAAAQVREPNDATTRASSGTGATGSHEEPVTERARREWALGCAAVLTERNHESHILLGGCIPGETTKADMRRRLSDGWGVNSRAEFFKTLDAIDEGGHRADFAEAGLLVSLLSKTQFQGLLRKADNPEAANRLRVVRQYYKQLGDKSIYGWDYTRAICLCRWAYVAGYIKEDEAWRRIMPMARLLQKKFDSWEDLGRNYLIGRQFWSYEETQQNGWLFEDAVQRLLDMRSSPWNRYPWEMNLQDGGEQESVPKEEPQEKPEEHEKGKEVIAALW